MNKASNRKSIYYENKLIVWMQTFQNRNGLFGKIMRRLLRYYRKWFQNRNHVFMHNGPFELKKPKICETLRFDKFEDIPEYIRSVIIQKSGPQTLAGDRREMDHAAVMWAAIYDQTLAGVLFSRKGKDFRKWFVKLKDQDLILFRMRTYPEFRGRGIAPFLMCYAMHHSLADGYRAFIDCRVYNKSSIRAIEKSGFDLLSTMKPISREFALGKD